MCSTLLSEETSAPNLDTEGRLRQLSSMLGSLTLTLTSVPNVFVAPDGKRLTAPDDWACLRPGDAGLTRRVKAAGPWWAIVEKRGRKTFSKGLWAPRANIDAARAALAVERATEGYGTKRNADVARREPTQTADVATFQQEVIRFLRFSSKWRELAPALARLVAAHATAVGSGAVARAERTPLEGRAEAAVIAWMRDETTAYDDMKVERIKGRHREVRRGLADVSRAVLDLHRRDVPHVLEACALCAAVVAGVTKERPRT